MQISLVSALLIALWAGYCSFDDAGPQWLRRPLMIGPMVGIIIGDLEQALIISATLELMWMGLGNMAGYSTPDMIIGTIVGVAFGITSGQGAATGVTLAVPAALLAQQLNTFYVTFKQTYTPLSKKLTDHGNFRGVDKLIMLSALIQFLYRAVPTFLIIYFGNDLVNQILAFIPANILTGLATASRMLPAIGLAILMQLLVKKGVWLFILLGFVLTAYLQLPIIAITIIGIIFGFIYDLATNHPQTVPVQGNTQEEEEELDL